MAVVSLVRNLEDCLNFVDHGFYQKEVRDLHEQGSGAAIYFEDMFAHRDDIRVMAQARFSVSIIDVEHLEEGFALLLLFDFETCQSNVILCNKDARPDP